MTCAGFTFTEPTSRIRAPGVTWGAIAAMVSANTPTGTANKGRMAVSYDADLTIVDLKAKKTITHDQQASRCGWTPFDGFETTGWPVATIVRGRVVMKDGELIGQAHGQPVRFQETLAG